MAIYTVCIGTARCGTIVADAASGRPGAIDTVVEGAGTTCAAVVANMAGVTGTMVRCGTIDVGPAVGRAVTYVRTALAVEVAGVVGAAAGIGNAGSTAAYITCIGPAAMMAAMAAAYGTAGRTGVTA